MAHAYTTKRGKNKMSKLGVRKDQQQNQEKCVKCCQNPSPRNALNPTSRVRATSPPYQVP